MTKNSAERISALRYDNQPVHEHKALMGVTNNYRASGGGRFPGLDSSNIVVSAPDANRDVLSAFIRAAGQITRARFGSDRNWHFAKVKTAGPVIFTSAAGKLDFAKAAGLDNVALWKDNGDGTAVYSVDLSR